MISDIYYERPISEQRRIQSLKKMEKKIWKYVNEEEPSMFSLNYCLNELCLAQEMLVKHMEQNLKREEFKALERSVKQVLSDSTARLNLMRQNEKC